MNLRDRLVELLEPCVAELGLVLWELEYLPRSNGALLRLYIDLPPGTPPKLIDEEAMSQAGITVDDCERVSHAVSEVLDSTDPIPGYYTLEVSSPGLDRVLSKREHFERYVGEPVCVELGAALNGRKRFSGQLLNVKDTTICVVVDGQPIELPLADIRKARLAPELNL
jgi:ribosome maturation factor RimP